MPRSEADELRLLRRAVEALRGHSDDSDIVGVVNALAPIILEERKKESGNGWAVKILYMVVGPLFVASVIGGVSLYGRVSSLETKIEQCTKVKP